MHLSDMADINLKYQELQLTENMQYHIFVKNLSFTNTV